MFKHYFIHFRIPGLIGCACGHAGFGWFPWIQTGYPEYVYSRRSTAYKSFGNTGRYGFENHRHGRVFRFKIFSKIPIWFASSVVCRARSPTSAALVRRHELYKRIILSILRVVGRHLCIPTAYSHPGWFDGFVVGPAVAAAVAEKKAKKFKSERRERDKLTWTWASDCCNDCLISFVWEERVLPVSETSRPSSSKRCLFGGHAQLSQ